MKKMHLVSHIHWDPAWYLPYEQYRITLIPAMKEILSMLENDEAFTSFMFDGQVDAIDGYLELFPEDRDRVERLVKNGKLRIGPWYIQPEEFLLSGESHIEIFCWESRKQRHMAALCAYPTFVIWSGTLPKCRKSSKDLVWIALWVGVELWMDRKGTRLRICGRRPMDRKLC